MQFNIREHPHLNYGYAVTSHSSRGVTADRVQVHVDTDQAHEQLFNSRLAYVSVSRGRYDVQIYTNDAQNLSEELSRASSQRLVGLKGPPPARYPDPECLGCGVLSFPTASSS